MNVCYLLRSSGWMDALQATLVQFFSYVGNFSPQGNAKELEDISPRTIMAIDYYILFSCLAIMNSNKILLV